jgi:hypothetical protein
VQAINLPGGFEFTTGGTGVVGYAGAALLGELADRLERVGCGDSSQQEGEMAAGHNAAAPPAGHCCLAARDPWSAWPRAGGDQRTVLAVGVVSVVRPWRRTDRRTS